MFDFSFMFESIANIISISWNVVVLPYKLAWIIIVLVVLAWILSKKPRSN